ncbi:hypothetical protein K4L44_17725 [Halosquirtibacter laminarini]|uniref:Uncharacterized protein n=1 Tax=Halosquirtibacter laminarini TaxID=3374600 RepID=A0AC61NFE0_9BACT|nr:hypothetical protein K4L44_17725 [Prolixibacteraceae bacterium]
MNSIDYVEWAGYMASVIVAISLTMTSMIKLRWFNMVGSLIFTIYGFLIEAYPIALVNAFIVGVNIVFLIKIYTKKDLFTILEVNREDAYFRSCLDYYRESLIEEYPDLDKKLPNESIILILRDMDIAGFCIGAIQDDTLELKLDYATPAYRDFKTGKYLFNNPKSFYKNKGIKRVISKPLHHHYNKYYKSIGFYEEIDQNKHIFIKEI